MIRFTINGTRDMQEALKRGEVVVVISGNKEPANALRKLMSDALVIVDATEEISGVKSANIIPAAIEQWVRGIIFPLVRGARDPEILVVTSWTGPPRQVDRGEL